MTQIILPLSSNLFSHFFSPLPSLSLSFLYHSGIGKNSREEEPVLKPALQLWLENGFKPSLTATEVHDNPGRYVRARKLFKIF